MEHEASHRAATVLRQFAAQRKKKLLLTQRHKRQTRDNRLFLEQAEPRLNLLFDRLDVNAVSVPGSTKDEFLRRSYRTKVHNPTPTTFPRAIDEADQYLEEATAVYLARVSKRKGPLHRTEVAAQSSEDVDPAPREETSAPAQTRPRSRSRSRSRARARARTRSRSRSVGRGSSHQRQQAAATTLLNVARSLRG